MDGQQLRELLQALNGIEGALRDLNAHTRGVSEAVMKLEHRYASLNMSDAERGARGMQVPPRKG